MEGDLLEEQAQKLALFGWSGHVVEQPQVPNVPMLGRMFEKRMRGYRSIGFRTSGFSRAAAEDDHVIEYDPEALQNAAELTL